MGAGLLVKAAAVARVEAGPCGRVVRWILEAAIAAVARAVAQAVVAGELQKFRLEQGASRSKQMELASCPPGRLVVALALVPLGGEEVPEYLLYLTCRRAGDTGGMIL